MDGMAESDREGDRMERKIGNTAKRIIAPGLILTLILILFSFVSCGGCSEREYLESHPNADEAHVPQVSPARDSFPGRLPSENSFPEESSRKNAPAAESSEEDRGEDSSRQETSETADSRMTSPPEEDRGETSFGEESVAEESFDKAASGEESCAAAASAPEDPSSHVHRYEAEQWLISAAYDEIVQVTDAESWDETVTVTDTEAWEETVTVVDRDAWDETVTVVDQEAWEETVTIVDQEAYDYVSEEIPGFRCRCGAFFSAQDDGADGSLAVTAHQEQERERIKQKYFERYGESIPADAQQAYAAELQAHASYARDRVAVYTHVDAVTHQEVIRHEAVTHTETVHHDALTHEETVRHPAVTHTEVIRHPAETHEETVHHDAVYEIVYVCTVCGERMPS